MDLVDQITRETAMKFMGIDLKYLVRGLEFHLEQCQKDDDITGIFRTELTLGNAKHILEEFCKNFPEHAPEL